MRFNPKARANPSQVEYGGRGGSGGGLGGGVGGGGMKLPIPTGGKFGWGTVIVIVLFVVLQMCTGGGLPGPSLGQDDSGNTNAQQQPRGDGQTCTGEQANQEGYTCDVELLTTSIQDYWARAFEPEAGRPYRDTVTVLFSGQTQSGCGAASSAMGPFYCPVGSDMRVYIDTNFMDQMLEGQLGAQGGTFALAYVLAHEYGHHIENLLGILGQIRTQQGPQSDAVKVELMADCLAGAWAKNATTTKDADGNVIIEDLTQDDIARAINAAQAVGDDYIQKRSSGRVDPEGWTHGSSEQRTQWFNTGLQEGSIEACNTFAPGALG